MTIVPFGISLLVTLLTLFLLIPKLRQAGMVGQDKHKPDLPEIPEMGGLGIIAGLATGIMASLTLKTFLGVLEINAVHLLAILLTVLVVAFIGIFDDLLVLDHDGFL